MRKFFARLSLAGALIAITSVAAPSRESLEAAPQLRLSIVRSSDSNCEPRCKFISAEGKIVPATTGQFRSLVNSLGTSKLPVMIHSGGGDVQAAMAIGRMLRAKGFDIVVARTEFSPETAAELTKGTKFRERTGSMSKQPALCASACTLIFAAGVKRVVYPWSHLGVHEMIVPAHRATRTFRQYLIKTLKRGDEIVSRERFLIKETKTSFEVETTKSPPSAYREVGAYLKQMGVSQELVSLMKTAPPEAIRWLTKSELVSTALSTEIAESNPLTHPARATPLTGVNAISALQPRIERSPANKEAANAAPTTRIDRTNWGEDRSRRESWIWGGLLALVIAALLARFSMRRRRFGPEFGPFIRRAPVKPPERPKSVDVKPPG